MKGIRKQGSLCQLKSDGRIVIFITSQNKKKCGLAAENWLVITAWQTEQGHMNHVFGSSITLAHTENNQNWREILPPVQFD